MEEGLLEMTERDTKEIHHALYYAKNLAHGTLGHNQLMLLAKMATYIGFRIEGTTLYTPDNVAVTLTGKSLQ